ncbi:flavin-containing monooxygenase [Nocardia brasiliensis]|uniref:flavin-containing monooxygenase n=1 Tax=Nocardia brasiliensis TaxID=37326 RepID=UPI003D90EAF8
MTIEYAETVIIGAGQQGCGVAASLQEIGHEAVIVEKAEVGHAWAHERWDSLLVGSGNRTIQFPGWEYDGTDPDGTMSGRELAGHLRRYAERRQLRVWQHTEVRAVECPPTASDRDDVRFRTSLSTGAVLESRNVVAAVGGYAKPRVPDFAADIDPAVRQVHSRDYRNPATLPDGAVLVVGAGISGQQIADELADTGRTVFLSVGRHRVFPRRYRGRGIHEWMYIFSLYDDFVTGNFDSADPAKLPGLPVTAVTNRGADLNLGTLAEKGVGLVGSVRAAQGAVLSLAGNVVAVAADSARSLRAILHRIDTGIRLRGFVAPEQHPPLDVHMTHIADFGSKLDLAEHDITAIIWCTGFGPDYRFLPRQALDEHGVPRQQQGMLGALPGLYYAGLPDGNSLHLTGIPATVECGHFIARQIHIDSVLRSGSPESVVVR